MSLLQKFRGTRSQGDGANQRNGVSPAMSEVSFDTDKNLKLLLNSIPSVVSYVDKNHCLQYVNQAFEAVFHCEGDAVVGRPIAEFMGVEGYGATKEYIETALSGKPVHYEKEVPFRDRTRFIEADYTPNIDEHGHVLGFIALIKDISETKKTEARLRRRELELQDYVDNAAERTLGGRTGNYSLGKQGRAGHARLFRKGIRRQTHCAISRRPGSHQRYPNALPNGEALSQYEARLLHKDGSIVTVLISSSGLWEEGKFVHTRCSTTDISYRKRMEESLEASRTNYRQLVENLPAAMYTCDAQGRITTYNKAAVEMWGREPEIGKDLWCGSWRIFEPDGVTPMELDTCPMAVALKEGRPVLGQEIIIERPDGKRRYVQPFPLPMKDKSGNVSGAINMLLDVTERKLDEQELAHFAAIVHSSHDVIISKTLTGIVTSWNNAAERVFGYSAAEMIGESILKLVPPDRAGEEPQSLNGCGAERWSSISKRSEGQRTAGNWMFR